MKTQITKGLILLLTVFLTSETFGQNNFPPKYEFRAAWIATVANIDWPSKTGLSTKQQKQEFIELLDLLKNVGMNAVIVQIRPAADAFYYSKYEPWSQWLTGKQGQAPKPYYDPLEFMIKETHKRNMEFHAWFNPYRAVFKYKESKTDKNHITNTKPEWFTTYGPHKFFNPGLPEVQNYVTSVIQDVVKRYDIDAVHFDDYFYPYKRRDPEGKLIDFPDSAEFVKYNKKYPDSLITVNVFDKDSNLTTETVHDTTKLFENKADWRRNNVDLIIKMLHDSIKSEKNYVKFGISPFGIWRNKKEDPRGSATNGYTNYDGLYADILKWMKNDWIDYVAPQLYWIIGKKVAAYDVLAEWWADNSYGKQVYIGQGLYRINSNKAWKNPSEIPNQIRLNRKYPEIKGNIFFSAKYFKTNPNGINDSLENNFFKYPALVPPMKYTDTIPPAKVKNLIILKNNRKKFLTWSKPESTKKTAIDTASYYVVYKFKGNKIGNLNNPENIYKIVRKNIVDLPKRRLLFRKKYTFAVTAVDRLHNEGEAAGVLVKN